MIYITTREAIRRSLISSELRLNLLRICSRHPRTIHELIHAPDYPGIDIGLFSLQSEISVSVELGECKNRGLLVRVGQVPDPQAEGGTTELLRTSLLAFLISPELARLEPAAYRAYIERWISESGCSKQEAVLLLEWLLSYPGLTRKAFYSCCGPAVDDPYFRGDPRRVFGSYYIADLPVEPSPLTKRDLWRELRKPPLLGKRPARPRLPLAGLAALLGTLRAGRENGWEGEVAPLAGPELLGGRLRPALPAWDQGSRVKSPS